MGESRSELLAWVNNLLQLNITKVEQFGTGAAFCQIFDSIWLDVPMNRVKFNVNTEYAYLQNFKILQNILTKHSFERTVPVEALVKCKMQDNLDFLQYTKRYWDQHYPGGEYDAVGRRKGAPGPSLPTHSAPPRSTGTTAARRPAAAATTTRVGSGAGGRIGATGGAASAALTQENNALKETVTGLERERDFYFNKLRDIEMLIQQAIEAEPVIAEDETHILSQIQAILYSTEEGFEIPAEGEAEGAAEEETF